MSFHDRVFGALDEASAMSDGYDHGPYKNQFTQGPKAGALMVKPRGASWTYNSIHVHNNKQGNVRGVGSEAGNVPQSQAEGEDGHEGRLAESLTRLRNLLG